MFTTTLTPRFYETDAFGHINNTVVNGWMETSRQPIFTLFSSGPSIKEMHLILARTEVDFVAQIYYGEDVQAHAFIERIGNSSFVVGHEIFQGERLVAKGKAVQVHFDQQTQQATALTDAHKTQLTAWMKPA